MAAKQFSQAAFGEIALHGITHGGNRGDQSYTAQLWFGIMAMQPPKGKQA